VAAWHDIVQGVVEWWEEVVGKNIKYIKIVTGLRRGDWEEKEIRAGGKVGGSRSGSRTRWRMYYRW